MTINRLELPKESACETLGEELARYLVAPLVMAFSGEIGAGKTTLIRAMLRSLGVTCAIKSPTFSLVESYNGGGFPIHHFDLYRIQDELELEYIGFRDYFVNEAVCCIEWPERAQNRLIEVDLRFFMTIKGNGRVVEIEACSEAGEKMLSCLKVSNE